MFWSIISCETINFLRDFNLQIDYKLQTFTNLLTFLVKIIIIYKSIVYKDNLLIVYFIEHNYSCYKQNKKASKYFST